MIRCQSCGYVHDEERTFCESCGTFLEWTSERIGERVGEQLEATPEVAEPDQVIGLISADSVHAADPLEEQAIRPPSQPLAWAPPESNGAAPTVPPLPGSGGAQEPPTPPPPPGVNADRPPPVLDPAEWRPPREAADTPRLDMATLRSLSRSPDAPSGPQDPDAPEMRRRSVEIQAPALEDDDESEAEVVDEAAAPMGPLMPTAQRSFEPRPSQRERPSRVPQPGDVICHQCGEANVPSRRTCRRCGTHLELPVDLEPVRLSWWRRLLRRLSWRRRRQRRYRAGERPALRGRDLGESWWRVMWRRIRRVARVSFNYLLALVAILALVGTILPQAEPVRREIVDTLEGAGQRVQRFFVPQYVRVNPIAVEASSQLPDRPAIAVADGFTNRHWSEGAQGPGIGESVTLILEEPVQLAELRIRNGGVGPDEQFTAQPRPRQVRLIFDDGSTQDVELVDQPGVQTVRVEGPATSRITLEILSVYAAAGPGRDASISEIELVRRL